MAMRGCRIAMVVPSSSRSRSATLAIRDRRREAVIMVGNQDRVLKPGVRGPGSQVVGSGAVVWQVER